jgi:L-lysine 6-transaminase
MNKPGELRHLHDLHAEFVETFARVAVPPTLNKHMFFIEGGSLGIENAIKTAFDWKIRKNLKKGAGEKGRRTCICANASTGRSG